MKKAFFITVFYIYNFISVFGQQISIGNEKLNIFYAGVDNPVSIAVENIFSKDLIVKVTNGKILKENGEYYFHTDSVGKTEVVIYKKSKEIGRRFFRVKPIPIPVFKIGSMRDSVPIVEISNQQYSRAELEGFDIDVIFRVEKFTAIIFSNDSCKVVRITNEGNKLGKEILDESKLFKPRDIVLFRDIFVEGPWGKGIKLKDCSISVY